MRGSRGQPPSNVAKAYAGAEQHARDPCTHDDTFLRNAGIPNISLCGCILSCDRRRCRGSRGGNNIRVDVKKSQHAGQTNNRGEHKAGLGAIDEVPQDRIGEGQGKGNLKG